MLQVPEEEDDHVKTKSRRVSRPGVTPGDATRSGAVHKQQSVHVASGLGSARRARVSAFASRVSTVNKVYREQTNKNGQLSLLPNPHDGDFDVALNLLAQHRFQRTAKAAAEHRQTRDMDGKTQALSEESVHRRIAFEGSE